MCFFWNTGKTISDDQMWVAHFASLQLLKMFIFFSSHFVLGGMASAWEGLLRITALSFLT